MGLRTVRVSYLSCDMCWETHQSADDEPVCIPVGWVQEPSGDWLCPQCQRKIETLTPLVRALAYAHEHGVL